MTQIKAAQPVFETTASALREKSKLQRHFRRFDMFFYLICTVVTIDTIGAVASNGAQGFTWLIFLGIFFFLPYALSVAELGSAFPQEGGPYVWTRLAFGRPLAAINSVIYWISNPIWIGGSLTIVSFAAIEEFFGPVGGAWKYVYAVAFIWFTIGAAIVSLQYGKWVPTLGAWARGAILIFFVFSVILYAAEHGVHGFGGHAFLPTYAVFIAVVPVLFFNYAGLEVPSAAGEEMTNPRRDVPFSVLSSGTDDDAGVRDPDPGDPDRAPGEPGIRADRVPGRGQGRIHRLRRPCRRRRDRHAHRSGTDPGPGRGHRVHLRPGQRRHDLDHGLRPDRGGGLLRRRRAPGAGPVLGPVRHPGRDEPALRAWCRPC